MTFGLCIRTAVFEDNVAVRPFPYGHLLLASLGWPTLIILCLSSHQNTDIGTLDPFVSRFPGYEVGASFFFTVLRPAAPFFYDEHLR